MQCVAALPVKEHLQALLWLAWCKGGHNTAPGLPLALINQRQVFVTPEDTTTPGCFITTQLHAKGMKHMYSHAKCRLRQLRQSAVTMAAPDAGLLSQKLMLAIDKRNVQLDHGLHTFHKALSLAASAACTCCPEVLHPTT